MTELVLLMAGKLPHPRASRRHIDHLGDDREEVINRRESGWASVISVRRCPCTVVRVWPSWEKEEI